MPHTSKYCSMSAIKICIAFHGDTGKFTVRQQLYKYSQFWFEETDERLPCVKPLCLIKEDRYGLAKIYCFVS